VEGPQNGRSPGNGTLAGDRYSPLEQIGDPRKGESVPMAPIAWKGLVFTGDLDGHPDR